ncbi:MarR family winged helix-turn-helix transcriptional regulator [Gluconacetobacter asukensis]|uniref:MarR family transcriptional regulator n=1 Tax=Gluconacetobacter asukensis TaxID=1017181 RepID=A0A7W4P1D1_9PROT|nr:MarR family transcriptional regulator [Gluconacetobacter asukensis]MBB2174011.1 MarR family transcriptional regulator [Gluconacetobacter asukensis]
MPTKTMHDAYIRTKLPALHRALIEIVGVMNRPERNEAMLKAAGLTLERALFPLLVLVERLGPIGVVDLAGRVGRDHTTVSRQIARLAELGLVTRHGSTADRRVREATITPQGKAATDAVDRARETMAIALFQDWSETDFDQLIRLIGMLAEGMANIPAESA